MKLVSKFDYTPLNRVTQPNGPRYYLCPETGQKLASVTTILDKTSDKTGLLEWKKRVGEAEAARISREAVGLGSLMHEHLEKYILGQPRPGGNNLVRQQAEAMADQIIEYGLCNVDSVYGVEVGLYYPGLYAGSADGIGELRRVVDGVETTVPAVFDFKTARKMKRKEHIENYFLQLCGYATAHDALFETEITTGVIFMVDRDFNYKEFVIEGEEFAKYREMWLDRLDQYYGSAQPLLAAE